MKKSYRVIAALTLASFLLTTILSDIAIGQPLESQASLDKLATPSNLDDIVMTDAQIMNNIALALYARLAFLNYQEKEIDTETLKTLLLKQKKRGDIRFERLNMEFYFEGLEAVLLSYFVVKCRVKINNEPITRYALFSPFRGDDDGFPIKVYTPEQIEKAYPGLGKLAARQSASGDKPLLAEYASGFTNLCGAHSKDAAESVRLAEMIFGAYKAEYLEWLNDANTERLKKDLIGIIDNIPADKAGAVITKALSILEEAGIGDEGASITTGLRAILKAKLEGRNAGDLQLIKGAPNRDSLLAKYERLFKSLCYKAQYSEKAVSLAEIIFNAHLTKLRGNVDETTRQSFIDKLESAVKGTSKEDIEQSFGLLAEAAINHSDIHDFDKDSIMNRLLGILNVKRSPKDIVEGFPIFNDRKDRRNAPRHSASGSNVSPHSATPDNWERLRMNHFLRRLANALNGPKEGQYLKEALYQMPEDIKTVPYLCAAREKNDDPDIRLAATRLLEEVLPNAFKKFVLDLVALPGESENAIVYTEEALVTTFCREMELYENKFEYEITVIAASVLQELREEGYIKDEEDGWIRTGKEPGRASASGNRTSTESARNKIQDYLATRTDIDVSVTAKALMVPAKDVIRELKHAGFVHRGGNKYYKLVHGGPTYDLRKKRGDGEVREGRASASGAYQVVTSRELGVSVVMGAVSNTLKDMMAGRGGLKPDGNYIIALPPKLFDGSRNYGELEFLLYFNAFIRGNLFKPNGQGLRVVGTEKQLKALTKYLELALFGPNLDSGEFSWLSAEEREFFKAMKEHYAVRSTDGITLPIDRYIKTVAFDRYGETEIEARGDDGSVRGSLKISQPKPLGGEPAVYEVIQRVGEEEKALGRLQIRYDQPEPQAYDVPQEAREALERGRYGFSRTWIGTSTGFDPTGDVTSQIIWLEGTGIWVDPSHEGLRYMRSLGLAPEDVPYILLTHTHQDHDGGILERILIGKKTKLIASRVVYEMFLMKARLLLGLTGSSTKPEKLVEWIPLNPGKPLAMKIDSGRKAVLRGWWNLHPIPTNGFSVTYDGFRYAHSGDTQWDPRNKGFIDELQGKGKLTGREASRQKRRFTTVDGRSKYDYIDFEGGGGMIHTKPETLAALPNGVRERLSVYHTADAEAAKYPGLRKARMFETDVFIPSDDERKERYMLGVLAGNALLHGKSGDFYEVFNRLARTERVDAGTALTIEGHRVHAVSYNGVQELFGEGPGAEGDKGRVYFIEGGRVGVWVGGKEVAELGPGQHFGDWSIVTGEPRSATVVAKDRLTVRSLTPEAYLALFGDAATGERIKWISDNIDILNKWTRKTTSRVFQDLTDFAITVLAGKSETRPYKAGSVIIKEGEASNGEFYIIKKGTVEVTKNGHPLAELRPYNHFGEIAILRNVERTATVTAKTDVEVLVLERGLVLELLDHYPSIRVKMDEEMARRIKDQIEDFVNRPSRRAFVSNLNVVELRILLAQLASRYGTDRVSLLFDMIDKKMVDLASGPDATLVHQLRGMGFSNIFGVDIAAEEAKPWLLRGDITDLKGEIPDGEIDVAFITNFLQNEYDASDARLRDFYRPIAGEIYRILKPGGSLYLVSGDEAYPALDHFREAGLEVTTLLAGMYEITRPAAEIIRQSASGEAEPVGRNYSVEVAVLIGEGRPHAAADIVGGLYRQWKELRQEDIESEASRMAGKSLREACLAIIKAQPLQRRQILKSERLGSEARRLLFVLGVSLSLSQKDRTGVPRKLLEFLFPLINSLKTEKPVTLNETIYLLKEGGMVWKDKNTNEWRMASIEGNYYLGVEELKAMRASLEFGGNLSERPTLTNPEAQKAQPPVILLAVSEAIGIEELARRDRFTKVYEVLKNVSPELAAKLQEVMKGIEGIIPDLGNRDLFNRIKALPVSRQEKEALSLAFEPGSEPIQAENRRFSASGEEDERTRGEITDMWEQLATEVGVNVALPVQNYTIFASYNLLTDEEYEKDHNDYLYRFGLERILTDKQEKMVDWVIGAVESKKLNPKDVIVQLPKDFSDDKYRVELEKLEARGIKFMILNTDGLEKESKEARAEYRRNIYAMMLLARNINKNTLPESSLYRLLRFFVASHLEDFEGKEAAIDKYIDDIKNNNIAGLIQVMLSYKPIAPYDSEKLREEYNGVAKALVSALSNFPDA